jgi:RND superfamily putative drug exporter
LFIVLCCCVTFTPALLRLTGRWAFWPAMRKERLSAREGWIPKSSFWTTLVQGERWPARFWEWTARVIDHRPGTVFLATVALMLPFIVVAVLNYRLLSYGLLSELRPTVTSVIGANAVREHFPAGMTGMTTILLRNDDFDLADNLREGERLSQRITDELERRKEELKIVDVRSQNDPLGKSTVAREYEAPLRRNIPKWNVRRTMAQRNYASLQGPEAGQVMKIDLVLSIDPFSRESISTLGQTEQAVREALQSVAREAAAAEDAHDADTDGDPGATRQQRLLSTLAAETQIVTLGSTASIRDLKTVTDRDRVRIAVLVTSAVFLVLLVLLGRPMISAYLVATVVFSFLVTLGVTHAVFWLLEPGAYAGLDWKVPVFVFTILVAIGEDYNVFLMTRVAEEQLKHGPKRGVLVALTKTGGIISSCGIIMAGTFLSLMTGTLTGIIQLGFALSFGVLLDTFVVRPILVPTYLVLLYDGRLGRLGELLGASQVPVVRLWAGHSSGTSAVPPPPHAEGLREVSETYRS